MRRSRALAAALLVAVALAPVAGNGAGVPPEPWVEAIEGAAGTEARTDFATAVRTAPDATERALVLESGFSTHFFDVFMRSGYGWSKLEAAAWVTRDEAGSIRLVYWPSSGKVHGEVWRGPVPAGVVALLHTHPPTVSPRPSLVDARTAQRLGLPVYAIGRAGVWRVDAAGVTAAVADDTWFTPCGSGADCARRNAPTALVAVPAPARTAP